MLAVEFLCTRCCPTLCRLFLGGVLGKAPATPLHWLVCISGSVHRDLHAGVFSAVSRCRKNPPKSYQVLGFRLFNYLFPGGFLRKEGPGSDLPINLYRFVRVMKNRSCTKRAVALWGFVLSKSCLCIVAGGGGVFLFNWDDIGDIYRYSHPRSFLKFQILSISWDEHTHTFLDHIWVVL